MRTLIAILTIPLVLAQDQPLRTTARLVLTPVSVTDGQGSPVEGLQTHDLIVYDNNVPVRAQIEETGEPLSLALVIQATASAQPVLDKLRKEASLIGPLLMGHRGEAAVVAFADEVRLLQDFTADADKMERAIGNLDAFGNGGALLDAVAMSMRLLAQRKPGRRRAILVISEKHDRSSNASLDEVVRLVERVNPVVYSVRFSPTKTAFASRAPKYCGWKCRVCDCKNCGDRCDRGPARSVQPATTKGLDLIAILGEWKRQSQPDATRALASLTGGTFSDFVRKRGLEEALQRIGDDLHRQYLVSFTMSKFEPGSYHRIRVEVRDRPGVLVRSRAGYYEMADE